MATDEQANRILVLAYLPRARCVKADAMFDLTSGQKYCFRCYAIRTHNTYDHAVLHSHHAVKGTADARCHNCDTHLTVVRPVEACVKCRHNLCIILNEMVKKNVDLDRARYRFNLHSFQLEYFTLE